MNKIRYVFEHRLLPEMYFEDKEELIALLLEEEGILIYRLMHTLFRDEGMECPYTKEQFQTIFERRDELFLVVIRMPQPEEKLLCSSIILIFDEKFQHMRYLTVEFSEKVKKGGANRDIYMMGEWTSAGWHRLYGQCGNRMKSQLHMAVQIDRQKIKPLISSH